MPAEGLVLNTTQANKPAVPPPPLPLGAWSPSPWDRDSPPCRSSTGCCVGVETTRPLSGDAGGPGAKVEPLCENWWTAVKRAERWNVCLQKTRSRDDRSVQVLGALLPRWTGRCASEQGSSLGLWHLLGCWTWPQVWPFYCWAPKINPTLKLKKIQLWYIWTKCSTSPSHHATHTWPLLQRSTSPLNLSCVQTLFHLLRRPLHPNNAEQVKTWSKLENMSMREMWASSGKCREGEM